MQLVFETVPSVGVDMLGQALARLSDLGIDLSEKVVSIRIISRETICSRSVVSYSLSVRTFSSLLASFSSAFSARTLSAFQKVSIK